MPENVIELTLDKFIEHVAEWRAKYWENRCVHKVEAIIQRRLDDSCLEGDFCTPRVEELIEQRVRDLHGVRGQGYLEKADIEIIVHWGSKKMGSRLWSRIDRRNTDDQIKRYTANAIRALDSGDPVRALKHINCTFGLDDAFGSKVIAFLHPQSAPVLDKIVRDCLSKADNPIRRHNGIRRYDDFIALCKHIAERQTEPNPRGTGGVWYLRDIEMALFQFGWDKGKPAGRITGTLPLLRPEGSAPPPHALRDALYCASLDGGAPWRSNFES